MKTKAELKALKEEVEALNRKLAELSEEELAQVTGGWVGLIPGAIKICPYCGVEYTGVHDCNVGETKVCPLCGAEYTDRHTCNRIRDGVRPDPQKN